MAGIVYEFEITSFLNIAIGLSSTVDTSLAHDKMSIEPYHLPSPPQLPHRRIESLQRQRIHPPGEELPHQAAASMFTRKGTAAITASAARS